MVNIDVIGQMIFSCKDFAALLTRKGWRRGGVKCTDVSGQTTSLRKDFVALLARQLFHLKTLSHCPHGKAGGVAE